MEETRHDGLIRVGVGEGIDKQHLAENDIVMKGLSLSQSIRLSSFRFNTEIAIAFDDRLDAANQSIERFASIWLLRPKCITYLLLGQLMFFEEHLHQLMLHRGEVDGLLRICIVEAIVFR